MKGLAAMGLAFLATMAQANTMNRLYVADMSDFGKKLGFYVDFENEAPDGKSGQVESLKAFLGVADGTNWKFISSPETFHLGQTVHLEATISGKGAAFSVNGKLVQAECGFLPGTPAVLAANVPAWASGPTNYRLVEKSLRIAVGGKQHDFKFANSSFSPVLSLFENPLPMNSTVPIESGQEVRVEADVEILPLVDANGFKPIIDSYGQVIQAEFPGKIASDAALKSAFEADNRQLAVWKPRTDADIFGGKLKSSLRASGSGFYRTVKRNGYWWLISPLGNPVFFTGVCTAPSPEWDSTPVTGREDLFTELPPKSGISPSLWSHGVWGGQDNSDQAAVHALNLIRRFGKSDFDRLAKEECRERLAAWGFTGLGKWCETVPKTPVLPVVSLPGVPKIDRHFDVFDPTVRVKLRTVVEQQIKPNLKNPFILGYSYGNEYDEIITPGEIINILASRKASPAKAAFVSFAVSKIYGNNPSKLRAAWGGDSGLHPLAAPSSDVEAIRRFYASKYYSTLYSTFKSVDPNHLYFGFWIVPGWWVSDEDWNLIAPNVDVIGFDRYADWQGIENLLSRFDKPVLLGEFSFPSWYGGARGFGRYQVFTESDADSGTRYAKLVSAAARCRECVGTLWFQYRDEPITGRGPSIDKAVAAGEHYAFGLVDACDLPKYDLVRLARQANLAANDLRLKATKGIQETGTK